MSYKFDVDSMSSSLLVRSTTVPESSDRTVGEVERELSDGVLECQ